MLIAMPSQPSLSPTMPADEVEALAGRAYGATLWTPGPGTVQRCRISQYARWLAEHVSDPPGGHGYADLWQWSVDDPGRFWASIWAYFDVLGERGDGPALRGGPMPDVTWFAGSTLNYARNALRWARADPGRVAIRYSAETGRAGQLSYRELERYVARAQAGLRALGVGRGDRVAGYLPNGPEALVAMLATASLGAIWTGCSPDFGATSVIDRFAQISPRVLIAVDGYVYGGKRFDRRSEVAAIASALPGLTALVTVDYLGAAGPGAAAQSPAGQPPVRQLGWAELTAGDPAGELEFTEVPFDHPLWVLYSSGTTGLPKAILHSHGGIVLEHLKALCFHQDLGLHPHRDPDVFFWYTTTGWMMWNYLVGGLLAGVTIVLYDGSATYPATDALWRLAAAERVTYAGTGAPYLLACQKAGLRPAAEHDLSRLRGLGSTGSPLPPEGFRWVYDEVAPGSRAGEFVLGSISGGTDVCTAFVGPAPLLPVRVGVIPGPCLGAKVESFDAAGQPVTGEVGELVVTEPMPSMPVGFWADPGGERYRASYYADYPGVWRHGDWIMILPDGGSVIYGRSDATLNRGGVRMGTSEFYRVVEGLPGVADSLVVDTGQLGQDGQLLLYVVPAAGRAVDDELRAAIRSALRSQLSPRHVPDDIRQVPGIPRTLSGKKLEVPVRKILLGTAVADAADPDALANPEVLRYFVPGAPAGDTATATATAPTDRHFGEEGGLLTYGSYLRLPELLAQQVTQTDPPAHDELLFITVHQAYELWFQQLLHELTAVRDLMLAAAEGSSAPDTTDGFSSLSGPVLPGQGAHGGSGGRAPRPGGSGGLSPQDKSSPRAGTWRARHLLGRAHVIERLLVSQIDVLETMTPQDFLDFRAALAPASGFQSVQFRELEFLSGAKDPRFVGRFRSLTDAERRRLDRRLAEPSLWDAYLGLLTARGLATGDDAEVLATLVKVARDRGRHDDLWQLAESLLSHDELAGLWRARHVQMVERQIGTKSGTGGSTGAPYLHRRVPIRYYPLLWELRDWL
jgi:acetoacetyl-CoA synthetase